jgi:hypothetical protein
LRASAAVSGRAARASSVDASRRSAIRDACDASAAAATGARVWSLAPVVATSATMAASAASTRRTRSIVEPNGSIVDQVHPIGRRATRRRALV